MPLLEPSNTKAVGYFLSITEFFLRLSAQKRKGEKKKNIFLVEENIIKIQSIVCYNLKMANQEGLTA